MSEKEREKLNEELNQCVKTSSDHLYIAFDVDVDVFVHRLHTMANLLTHTKMNLAYIMHVALIDK